jgi:hypothetical protein
MRALVRPELAGRVFGSVLSEGQIASSMISIQDAPMYVLILVVRPKAPRRRVRDEASSPKVNQSEDHAGHNGKVRKVEPKRCA